MSLNGKKIANVYLIIKNPGHPKTFHQPVICACEGGGRALVETDTQQGRTQKGGGHSLIAWMQLGS